LDLLNILKTLSFLYICVER